jgi:hypothetical protein
LHSSEGSSIQSWIICGLIGVSVAYGAVGVLAVSRGADVSDGSEVLWTVVYSVLVTLWARADGRASNVERDYSWLLMFFFWPVVLAYHLVKSRRFEGLMLYLGFMATYLAPNFAQVIASVCCEVP